MIRRGPALLLLLAFANFAAAQNDPGGDGQSPDAGPTTGSAMREPTGPGANGPQNISGPNTQKYTSGGNTQQFISGPNTQQFMYPGNTQTYFSGSPFLPPLAPGSQQGGAARGARPAAPQPASDGIYRSTRGASASNKKSTSTTVDISSGAARADEPPPAITLETARENIPSIVAAYVARDSRDSIFILRDAASGNTIPARFEGVDGLSVSELGAGRYTASARFRDRTGKPVIASATVDLSGNEWTVVSIERLKPGKAFDSWSCFSSAVSRRLRAGARGKGPFVFRDEDGGSDRRLTLKLVHKERLASYGKAGYYSCVDFLDRSSGQVVDLDFYVSASHGSCSVDEIVVHRVDGKARTIQPKPAGA